MKKKNDAQARVRVVRPFEPTGVLTQSLISAAKILTGTDALYTEVPETLHDLPSGDDFKKGVLLAEQLRRIEWLTHIEKTQQLPDEPLLHIYHADWSEKLVGGKHGDFFDDGIALRKCLSELVERQAWFKLDHTDPVYKSVREMGSECAFSLSSLAGFSESQKNTYPFLRVTDDSVFAWAPVRSILQRHQRKMCPLQLLSNAYEVRRRTESPHEPILRFSTTNGLATSPNSIDEAILNGMLELIERDAFMIAYLNSLSPDIIDLDHLRTQSEQIDSILNNIARVYLTPVLIRLPTDFPVHVVFSVIFDESGAGPAIVTGAKASRSLEDACIGALREATTAHIEQCTAGTWEEKEPGPQDIMSIHPRVILWSKKHNLHHLDFLFKGKTKQFVCEPAQSIASDLSVICDHIRSKGYSAWFYSYDLPKEIPLTSVMVVIPELIPLLLTTNIPYLGGERIDLVPRWCGYSPAKQKNTYPHPFV